MDIQPVADVVTAANVVAKLPFWAELDAEALLVAYREKLAPKAGAAGTITAAGLKELFLSLGYDKQLGGKPEGGEGEAEGEAPAEGEEAPAAEEGGEEAPAAEEGAEGGAAAAEGGAADAEGGAAAPAEGAPAEPQTSDNYAKTWEAVCGQKESVQADWLVATLALFKSGYGEAALRFAVKAVDADGSGALSEAALWRAVTRAASSALTPTLRNHLRKAWRGAEKYVPPEEEPKEEEGEGEGAEAEAEGEAPAEGEEGAEKPEGEGEAAPAAEEPAAPPAPKAPEEPRVLSESFLGLVLEDEALAAVLAKEVPVPIEEPPAPEEGEGEGEEE